MSATDLEHLRATVLLGEPDDALAATQALLDAAVPPIEILEQGLTAAMLELGERWKAGDVFLPEVVAAATVFSLCADLIEPALLASAAERVGTRILLATVKGDLHDLGKNMVIAMLKTAGFDVVDLGKDVAADAIVDAVRTLEPQIVGLSALLTTTVPEQRVVIEALERAGLRDRVKVLVGGAPVTQEWADLIGADGYARHAPDAIRIARELAGVTAPA
jgi:5-methyltetrahydrofolate--homocysteine methyltransferase